MTASPIDDDLFKRALAPKLADYGLSIQKTPAGYFNLTSDRMLLEPPIERAAEQAFADLDGQPVFTYLANYILAGDGKAKIPYSTVAALDLREQPPLGPFLTPDGKTIDAIKDDEIVLNSWAADDMAKQGVTLKPGDTIQLQYFEPESLHGEAKERTADFRLKAIVELAGAAADPNLTPELKGVTDRQSIANWNPPFKFDPDRVRAERRTMKTISIGGNTTPRRRRSSRLRPVASCGAAGLETRQLGEFLQARGRVSRRLASRVSERRGK